MATETNLGLDNGLTIENFNSQSMVEVESSNIHSIGYFPITHTPHGAIAVQFKSGIDKQEVYLYHPFNKNMMAEFLAAESKGKFLNKFIKNSAVNVEKVTTLWDQKDS